MLHATYVRLGVSVLQNSFGSGAAGVGSGRLGSPSRRALECCFDKRGARSEKLSKTSVEDLCDLMWVGVFMLYSADVCALLKNKTQGFSLSGYCFRD